MLQHGKHFIYDMQLGGLKQQAEWESMKYYVKLMKPLICGRSYASFE